MTEQPVAYPGLITVLSSPDWLTLPRVSLAVSILVLIEVVVLSWLRR